jgi:hypothetical protein
MGNELTKRDDNIIASIVLRGDISGLNETDKVQYYNRFCESLGLNPLTRPFQYLRLNGKEVLYATKDATEQLRKINGVSVLDIDTKIVDDVYVVKAHGQDASGRTDTATGVVTISYPERVKERNGGWKPHPKAGQKLAGDDLANAIMKAETKAKRRLTLSICGLGILDETELETIPASAMQTVAEVQVDRALPNLEKGREEIEKLIERYETLVMPAVIDSTRLDMEAAKSINDMRGVYRYFKTTCEAVEREQSKVESLEGARTAGAAILGMKKASEIEPTIGDEPELPEVMSPDEYTKDGLDIF